MDTTESVIQATDYLIIGAGAMGMAFADEILSLSPNLKISIVDRRAKPGGHWNDAYPFVRLHQPAAFYGVNSLELGEGTTDLSSKGDILDYYDQLMNKFIASGRVQFLLQHTYLGDGKVACLLNPTKVIHYQIRKKLVDATYMKVEVPSVHSPKYHVSDGVSLIPINELIDHWDKWDQFYVIGNGKTGMDAILYLIDQGVSVDRLHWICPNQAWLFHREDIQVGKVAKLILRQVKIMQSTRSVDDFFLAMEQSAGIMRIDQTTLPKKWRCATVSTDELAQLKRVDNLIQKGRVQNITDKNIQLELGAVAYSGKALFVDCSANGLSREQKTAIFSDDRITLQAILFCQQVFSAAVIAKMELTKMSNQKKNHLVPVPHPEFKEDWPSTLASSLENLLLLHRHFPLWIFRSRLNFMSHEPILKYFYYAAKAILSAPGAIKGATRLDKEIIEQRYITG